MTKIAKVIVDVPLMQTDKPFSYKIPEALLSVITAGSRVHVPFGKGNRLLQGFVVSVDSGSAQHLKTIIDVLDVEPVLNQEQLELADQMRKTVFSYKISILKSMIPNLLNSNYDRLLKPKKGLSQEEKDLIFAGKKQINFSQLNQEIQTKSLSLIQAGKIDIEYLAKDRKTIKTQKCYDVNLEKLSHLLINKRAKKRQELKDYLANHPQSGPLSDLYRLFQERLFIIL